MKNRVTKGLTALVLLAACGEGGPQAALQPSLSPGERPSLAVSVDGVIGNPSCAELFPGNLYIREFKLSPEGVPTAKTYTSADGYLSFTVSNVSGSGFDWSSNRGVDGVLLKAGSGTSGPESAGSNLYTYDPEATSGAGLKTQQNKTISHVTVCYDVELSVRKTAVTTYDRDWTWSIDKTGDATSLLLTQGQSHDVNYTVVVSAAKTDANWSVSGVITIENPLAGESVVIGSVADVVSTDLAAAVDCGTLPRTLAGGASMTCTYTRALPDGVTRTNVATASSTTPGIAPGSGSAPVTFGNPASESDECVTLSDDKHATPSGQLCAPQSPKTYTYTIDVGKKTSATCGSSTYTNTATFVSTEDATEKGSDSHSVAVSVTGCGGGGGGEPDGCTLTQGYWKTHSLAGPAPYDDNWLNVGPAGSSTPFFGTAATWYTVLWTAPKGGNVYYQLAHQYAAAILNQKNGAVVPDDVKTALEWTTIKFGTWDLGAVSGADRTQAAKYATLLESYNSGVLHCSERTSL